MLKNYATQINDVALPFPKSWDETPKKIVANFESESGKRKQIVKRNSRLLISAEYTVSSRWLKKFKQFRDLNTLTVKIYEAETGTLATHEMSITEESFHYSLIENSKNARNTDGLWLLSFDLEEF